MSPHRRGTIEDLYRVLENGKAELVNGEIMLTSPTGGILGRSSGRIYVSLDDYERRTGRGYAFPDKVGFVVDLSNRGSFSPDAAFHPSPLQGGRFMEGAPVFSAEEVRSENDYGKRPSRRWRRSAPITSPRHPDGVERRRPA